MLHTASRSLPGVKFVTSDLIETLGHLAHGTLVSNCLSAAHWAAVVDGELCALKDKHVWALGFSVFFNLIK